MKFLTTKNILITLVIGIAVLFILSLITVQKNVITNNKSGFSPTPTPFFIKNLSVSHSSPTTNTTDVKIIDSPSLTFSRDLNPLEQQQIKISVSPQVSGSVSWKNPSTIVFTPTISFSDKQTYTITASSLGQSYTWDFTTGNVDNLTDAEKGVIQARLDDQVVKDRVSLLKQYPWYPSLPLSTDDYFVFFDTKTKIFNVDLYTNSNSSSTINSLKQEINATLIRLGVNTSIYQFHYNILPKSE